MSYFGVIFFIIYVNIITASILYNSLLTPYPLKYDELGRFCSPLIKNLLDSFSVEKRGKLIMKYSIKPSERLWPATKNIDIWAIAAIESRKKEEEKKKEKKFIQNSHQAKIKLYN